MRPGARPRVLLWPGPFHPGPQYGNPDHATQRSGKRRHLRQQEAEMLSGDLLLGKRRIPPVTRLHREAGGAQGVRSIRIAQGTVNKLGGGALRGSARVRAALLHSGRPGSRPTGAPKTDMSTPAGGVSPPDPRRGEGRHSARRRRQRRRPAARGARRGPARTTKTRHPTAPRAHHRVLAHTHRLAPYRARGAAPISPTSVNWPFPPRAERGSSAVPIQQRAGHQAVDYSRGASRRRSLKLPRRPRQPATRRQGARRGAHRRPPHTSPTTDRLPAVTPWRTNAPSQKTHHAYPCG